MNEEIEQTTMNGSLEVERGLGTVWLRCSQQVVCRGLGQILEGECELHVGETPGSGEVPGVTIVVASGEHGAADVARTRQEFPETEVVLLCWEADLQVARDALRSGARGIIYMDMTPAQMVRSLELAARGELVVPRRLLTELVSGEIHLADTDALTFRQRQVLKLVEEGLSNAQIANRLYLSEFTVKQHLRAAYKALGVKNRTEAARVVRASLK